MSLTASSPDSRTISQPRFANKHGNGTAAMSQLAAAYWQNQQSNIPVHLWGI